MLSWISWCDVTLNINHVPFLCTQAANHKTKFLLQRASFADDSKNPIWRRCFPYVPQYHQSSLTSHLSRIGVCVKITYFLVHFQITEKTEVEDNT